MPQQKISFKDKIEKIDTFTSFILILIMANIINHLKSTKKCELNEALKKTPSSKCQQARGFRFRAQTNLPFLYAYLDAIFWQVCDRILISPPGERGKVAHVSWIVTNNPALCSMLTVWNDS